MLILRLLIFSLPWIAWPGREDAFLGPKQAIFLVGCWALLLTTWLSDQPKMLASWRNPWTRRFALYVLLFGAFRFWVPFLDRTPESTQVIFNWYLWEASLYVLTGILVVHCLVTHWLTSMQRATQLTQWSCQSATAVAVYVLCQRLGIDQFYATNGTDAKAWFAGFGNTSMMASYLALGVPLFLLFWKRKYLFFLGLVLLAIGVTDVRYAQLAAGASLLTYGSLRLAPHLRPWLRVTLGGILILLIGLGLRATYPMLQADERWPIWQETVRIWKEANPEGVRYSWTGRGVETFPDFFGHPREELRAEIQARVKGSRWLWAHNDLLQALFEWGLMGTGLLLLSLWTTLTLSWDSRQTILGVGWLACAVSLLIISLTHFPWHLAPTAFQGLLIWAMCERTELSA